MFKKVVFSFATSCCCGLVIYTLIELIAGVLLGVDNFSVMTPEYRARFSSEILAFCVLLLSHGVIGATFAAATVIYEKVEIGFILQNIIYYILTGVVWIPIICFIWQLYLYPTALLSTMGGFIITYVIMSVVGYNVTKKEVAQINARLAEEN